MAGRRKSNTVSPPLFQIHRFTKKYVVLSSDFDAANQRRDRLPLKKSDFTKKNFHTYQF